MAETIPLFPLQTMLFPGGEIALQLFEPRYLDMIKRCMRDDSGFGVVAIRAGSEVADKSGSTAKLVDIGTYARIVDWDALENGRLGVIARGGDKFRILNADTQPDHLVVAAIEFLAAEQPQAMPDEHQYLTEILNDLVRHPSVAHMRFNVDDTNATQISNLLGQLLPVSTQAKYELLCCTDALQRLARISDIIAELGGNQ
ncbi:MAG: LON peptidase substrate-binding domain-containing protein [Pseudomonadales bacterium]